MEQNETPKSNPLYPTTEEILHNPHDTMFKAAFMRKDVAEDYIKAFLPRELTERLALDKMVLDNNSYIDEKLKATFADVVWMIPYGSMELQLTFLFEHKKTPDKYVLLQVLQYMLNMWNQQREAKETLKVIIPIIVYQGKRKWRLKPFEKLFPKADEVLKKYIPSFDFIFKNLVEATPKELYMLENQYAYLSILTLARAAFPDFFEHFKSGLSLKKITLDADIDGNFIQRLYVYIFAASPLDASEIRQEFKHISSPVKKYIMTAGKQLFLQGKREGKLEGKLVGKLEGKLEGKIEGFEEKETEMVLKLHKKGKSYEEISDLLDIKLEKVSAIIEKAQNSK